MKWPFPVKRTDLKRALRFLCTVGLLAAFLAMAVAMVLPHAHDTQTHQHVCWICHAKAIGVAAPSAGPGLAVLRATAFVVPAAKVLFEPQVVPLFFEARAPPLFSSVLS